MNKFPFDLRPQHRPQGFGRDQVDSGTQERFQFELKPHEGALTKSRSQRFEPLGLYWPIPPAGPGTRSTPGNAP
jgi:hypothetical protein